MGALPLLVSLLVFWEFLTSENENDLICRSFTGGGVVAGAGFEPATFWL